jgi:Flp pilus assembly pilin Flp
VSKLFRNIWSREEGQGIAEYAIMMAVVMVIVAGTVRLIGANANKVFSSIGSSVH